MFKATFSVLEFPESSHGKVGELANLQSSRGSSMSVGKSSESSIGDSTSIPSIRCDHVVITNKGARTLELRLRVTSLELEAQ